MDDKGYVLSGFGFLLLIPVMILIPIAISLEVQSSNLPNTFVKTDTIFQAYKDIQADLSSKVNQFTGDPKKNNGIGTFGAVYQANDTVNKFAGNITYLYSRTLPNQYSDTFANTLDSVTITPGFSDTLSTGNNSGTIPLNNGIKIDYLFLNKSTDAGGYILYNYSMNVTINMNIDIKKGDGGLKQQYLANYPVRNAFQVNSTSKINSTAESNINTWFSSLNSAVQGISL
jgi:hypothetical protein